MKSGFSFVPACWPLLAVVAVYVPGMLLDIMDIDAAQYASISLEMMRDGNYLQLYHRGQDYLDKPPLLFWVTSLVFQIFGAGNFTYRLVPVLVCLLGAYATYRLALLYYTQQIAWLSSLIYLSSYSVFLMNHDVRTDTMLMGWTAFAVWQLAEYMEHGRWHSLAAGFTGVGLAMLAKGPIGLMVPVLALGTDVLLKRRWKFIFHWPWLLGLLIVALILLPMCVGLYLQFDLHPEKVMYEKQGTSGLYFYFWQQSFGRLTGENYFKDDSDAFFFVHTYLWSVLPWGLLLIPAFFRMLKQTFRFSDGAFARREYLTLGGFILPFVALSMSQYKLPHYINIIIPFGSIMTARYIFVLLKRGLPPLEHRVVVLLQWLVVFVLWLLGMLFALWVAPMTGWWQWLVVAACACGVVYIALRGRTGFQRTVLPSVLTMVGLMFIFNTHFYPWLFQYQGGSVLGKILRHRPDLSPENFAVYSPEEVDDNVLFMHSIDFYSQRINTSVGNMEELLSFASGKPVYLYTNEHGLERLKSRGQVDVVKQFENVHVALLSVELLNPDTRSQAIRDTWLVYFTPHGGSVP